MKYTSPITVDDDGKPDSARDYNEVIDMYYLGFIDAINSKTILEILVFYNSFVKLANYKIFWRGYLKHYDKPSSRFILYSFF
jgi:hypothetical protein